VISVQSFCQPPLCGSHSNTLLASFNNRILPHEYLPHASLSTKTPTFPISEDARSGTQSFGEQYTRRNPAGATESSFPPLQAPSTHSDHGVLHASLALSPPPLMRPSPLARTWPNSLTQLRVVPGSSHTDAEETQELQLIIYPRGVRPLPLLPQ
jgi:hypothetical protein